MGDKRGLFAPVSGLDDLCTPRTRAGLVGVGGGPEAPCAATRGQTSTRGHDVRVRQSAHRARGQVGGQGPEQATPPDTPLSPSPSLITKLSCDRFD